MFALSTIKKHFPMLKSVISSAAKASGQKPTKAEVYSHKGRNYLMMVYPLTSLVGAEAAQEKPTIRKAFGGWKKPKAIENARADIASGLKQAGIRASVQVKLPSQALYPDGAVVVTIFVGRSKKVA